MEHVIFDNERNFFMGAFSSCHKLNIKEISGHINMWNIDGNRLLGYVPDIDEFEVIIPEGISEIEENAFAKADWIKKIVLPSSLKIIEKETFLHFIYLEEVVISEGIEEKMDIKSVGKRFNIEVLIHGEKVEKTLTPIEIEKQRLALSKNEQ